MITKLIIRNFKSISEEEYTFTNFDLLVGRNNSGKSTILQALAIWQFCISEFSRAKRTGTKGIQFILPNFTALPVPKFNLLWKERTDRKYPDGKKTPEYILIEIIVTWLTQKNEERNFGIKLRYNSPQSVYAIPMDGWGKFRKLKNEKSLPVIAYIPPFSGLEPTEEWRDEGPILKQVGKAQPGSILRNLLLKVRHPSYYGIHENSDKNDNMPNDWLEIKNLIERWFSVELIEPKYERGVDTQILCEYKQGNKSYDIIAGGSGFHQTLTLLAFLYGYMPTTILIDEPDAHLHANLQREILDYFKRKSIERNIQFLIATHAEEFVLGVDVRQIVSLMSQVPRRIESTPQILTAMSDVSNLELSKLMDSPFMLYVEGESDERLLRTWASTCDYEDIFSKVCFKSMEGGSKEEMKKNADRHFKGVNLIIPDAKRLMVFDLDTEKTAFHPSDDNPSLFEWKRKNIENYLFVPDAWIKACLSKLGLDKNDLFFQPMKNLIYNFFNQENLALPENQTWRTVNANIFKVLDGKKLLYEDNNSLFQQLRNHPGGLEISKETVAAYMVPDEIHNDIHNFFSKLKNLIP